MHGKKDSPTIEAKITNEGCRCAGNKEKLQPCCLAASVTTITLQSPRFISVSALPLFPSALAILVPYTTRLASSSTHILSAFVIAATPNTQYVLKSLCSLY